MGNGAYFGDLGDVTLGFMKKNVDTSAYDSSRPFRMRFKRLNGDANKMKTYEFAPFELELVNKDQNPVKADKYIKAFLSDNGTMSADGQTFSGGAFFSQPDLNHAIGSVDFYTEEIRKTIYYYSAIATPPNSARVLKADAQYAGHPIIDDMLIARYAINIENDSRMYIPFCINVEDVAFPNPSDGYSMSSSSSDRDYNDIVVHAVNTDGNHPPTVWVDNDGRVRSFANASLQLETGGTSGCINQAKYTVINPDGSIGDTRLVLDSHRNEIVTLQVTFNAEIRMEFMGCGQWIRAPHFRIHAANTCQTAGNEYQRAPWAQ